MLGIGLKTFCIQIRFYTNELQSCPPQGIQRHANTLDSTILCMFHESESHCIQLTINICTFQLFLIRVEIPPGPQAACVTSDQLLFLSIGPQSVKLERWQGWDEDQPHKVLCR